MNPSQESFSQIFDQNLRLLTSGQVKALKIFEDQEFIQRDGLVLKAFGVDPSGAEMLTKSRFTTRRCIFDKTEANRKMIREQIPVIAQKFGGVGWAFDHKVSLSLYPIIDEQSQLFCASLHRICQLSRIYDNFEFRASIDIQ